MKRRLALAVTAAVSSIAFVLSATPAQALATGDVHLLPTARCEKASGGIAKVVVQPPAVGAMPLVRTPNIIGDAGQAVVYQPLLQRWNGSTWVKYYDGPYYTGTAGWTAQGYYTTWDGWTSGTWTRYVNAQRTVSTQAIYYRVVAQIWWYPDAYRAGAYVAGIVEQEQWFDDYQKNLRVPYCTY